MADLLAYVKNLDVRTPQVAIKAKIIFVNRTDIEELGLSYDLGTGNDQFFSQLVQRIDPTTAKPVDTNGDGVPDAFGGGTPITGDRVLLGGNALCGDRQRKRTRRQPGAQARVLGSAWKVPADELPRRSPGSPAGGPPGGAEHRDARQSPAEILVGQEIPIRVLDLGTQGQRAARRAAATAFRAQRFS